MSTIMASDKEHRDLVTRLRVADERMCRLREEAGSGNNVIRFRVERHLEAAEEALDDIEARVAEVPPAGSYARRLLERGLCRAESEIVFAEAKLEAARAEEGDDLRTFVRATHRAMSAQRSALTAEIAPDPQEHTPRW